MSKKRVPEAILSPEYMKEFVCIGPECPDTCCAGWEINIDQKSYSFIKTKLLEHGKSFEHQFLKRDSNSNSPHMYAILNPQSKTCPFWDEDKLCSIQKNYGIEKLSEICATYPRLYNQVDNRLEISGDFSCPEIARLALLNPHGITFDLIPYEDIPRSILSHEFYYTNKRDLCFHFDSLQDFSIGVLQMRSLSLEERLFYLAFFANELTKLSPTHYSTEINDLITQTHQHINNNVFRNTIKSNLDSQYNYLSTNLIPENFDVVKSEEFKSYLIQIHQNLQSHKSNELISTYETSLSEQFKPFCTHSGYILENFLVNRAFNSVFPLNGRSPLESIFRLSMEYASIRFLLTNQLSLSSPLSEPEIVKTIQLYMKCVGRNSKMFNQLADKISKQEGNLFGFIMMIIAI